MYGGVWSVIESGGGKAEYVEAIARLRTAVQRNTRSESGVAVQREEAADPAQLLADVAPVFPKKEQKQGQRNSYI